ncbi:response regulator [Bacteroides sp. 224]|nr:response regulator [Bacteroides sp. 224]
MRNICFLFKKHLLLLIIFLAAMFPIHAAVNDGIFYFSNLDLRDGLSQLSVLDICEDSNGYIWMATRNGLNRFDGDHFVIYRHDNTDKNSISDNHITVLLPDTLRKGLWAGTNNGLNYIDLQTNRITSYLHTDYPEIPSNQIVSLCSDPSGNLWVGTRKGLCLFKPETQTFESILLNGLLFNETINALHIDKQNHFYIGTYNKGLFVCNDKLQIITQITRSTTPALTDNTIFELYEDSYGSIWIGTLDKGLNKWNPKDNTIRQFTTQNSGLSDENIRCFKQMNNDLIIGTFNGLSILNLSTDIITPYNNFDMRQGNLSHFSVYSLYIDKVNTLWVGTFSGGVNFYNPLKNRFTFYHPKTQNNIDSQGIFGVMAFHANHLWIATEGSGLYCFNVKTKQSENFLLDVSPQGPYNRNIIKSILPDGEYIWCGTNNGLIYRFHIPTKRFSLVHRFDYIKNLGIYTLFRDKAENWWIGTTAANGLIKIEKDGDIAEQIPLENNSAALGLPSVRSFLELKESVFLIGTRSNGLYKYDTQHKTIEQYHVNATLPSHRMSSNYVTSIKQSKKGEICIATFGGGIYIYDEYKGLIQHINKDSGLPNNNIYAMEEFENSIWVSHTGGISEVSLTDYQVKTYNCFNGPDIFEFTPQGSCCLPTGEIYFSGSNGFLCFHPKNLLTNEYIPSIVINQISVNNEVLIPGDQTGILKETPEFTEEMTLAYNQGNFSIAYCALNYIYHEQNQYAYRLLGHETNWNRVGTRKEAFYTNIAPGEYTFQVIGSNNDGIWNEHPKSIKIIVLPPWWKTPLAYFLYITSVLAVGITIGYYIYRKRELEHNLEIKQIERQKLEEFHQTKVRLFTNFSHELRTPLTLIISPLEEMLQQIEILPAVKQKLGMVYKNSQRLLLLVNQLMDLQKNQAGKLKLKLSHSDLNVFLEEMYLAFKQIAEREKIDFHYESLPGEFPAYFDYSLLEKVVFNLLSNAFKFTPTGESIQMCMMPLNAQEIKQKYHKLLSEEIHQTQAENFFMIRISDTGKGIPEEVKQHIFTPFYQVESSEQNNTNGTGIGLSLTQSIVRLHHGAIFVEDNTPKGTAFTIIIPNEKSAYSIEEQTSADHEQSAPVTSVDKPDKDILFIPDKKILIVEDNEEIRHYIKNKLEPYYTVLEADNGAVAFDIALQEFPDLIISDIMMPVSDGLELCARIKNDMQTGHIPVILLTARAMVMHLKEGYLSGADDYIVKPFNIEILLIRIYNLLSQREKLAATEMVTV